MIDNKLPIEAFKAEIMGCDAPYIIVEAETGSGKSTMVPRWFHELGNRVLVTEPLIETVIGTSEYVAQLMGVEFGTTVGYRTGRDRNSSPATEILFCTDGLALVRELSGHNRVDILIIDELHEWNVNQSTLEAWAWQHLQAGDSPFKKIVVLSATLASDELSHKRGNAPVFKVPGRQYPITDLEPGSDMTMDIAAMVARGHDVLAFQPGKGEIGDTVKELVELGMNAELIPFHGELSREEKNRAYRDYGRPKVVVSTNALETGRTLLPSRGRKLAVVDSGMERREELENGIEALVLAPIAKARGQQRRGRTGRVGEGVYIDHCPSPTRLDYPKPEILRKRLDQTVLRLAVAGYDASTLPFFHDLNETEIADARKALVGFGAMTPDGKVTEIGRRMSRLPCEVHHARMIIEAQERGVVDAVLTIVACLEAKGIRDKGQKREFGPPDPPRWPKLTQEKASDLLAELDCYLAVDSMSRTEIREYDINLARLSRAQKIRAQLASRIGVDNGLGEDDDRHQVLRACVAGLVDRLYRYSPSRGGYIMEGDPNPRELDQFSVVKRGDWIVGVGFDLHFKRWVRPSRWELEENPEAESTQVPAVKYLIKFPSAINPDWLRDYLPEEELEAKIGSRPETITVEGIDFHVTYEQSTWSTRTVARVKVSEADIDKITELPSFPKADRIDHVEVVDDHGTVIDHSYSLEGIQWARADRLKRELEQAEQDALLTEIRQLSDQCDELESRGRPVQTARQLLAAARSGVGGMHWSWSIRKSDPRSAIRQAQATLERLDEEGSDVLLADLMAGRISHPDIRSNMLTVQKINLWSIRTGGFIESMTDDVLRSLYRDHIGNVATAEQIRQMDLRIRLEDYVDPAFLAEMVEEGELELAPEMLELESRKGNSTYAVTYGYEQIDGQETAVGTIKVPIKLYELNCAQSGRKSRFPLLPHGIRLIIEVTEQNQTVARGEDGDRLKSQIKKHRSGKKRSGTVAEEHNIFGEVRRRTGPVRAEAPPPWFKGRAR